MLSFIFSFSFIFYFAFINYSTKLKLIIIHLAGSPGSYFAYLKDLGLSTSCSKMSEKLLKFSQKVAQKLLKNSKSCSKVAQKSKNCPKVAFLFFLVFSVRG